MTRNWLSPYGEHVQKLCEKKEINEIEVRGTSTTTD